MSENKSFIRFFAWITVLFLVLTYIFSVVLLSWQFMNSAFLEVIFGGLFASFGVMLLAEIKKYYINKRLAEDKIYYVLFELYKELAVETKNADVYLNNVESPVPIDLFKQRVPAIGGDLNGLRIIDYSPMRKNPILEQWNAFRQSELSILDNHLIDCDTILSLAIINEQLRALERQQPYYNPSAKDHDVNVALRKMKASAIERMEAIEKVQKALSVTYGDRYLWMKDKEKMDSISIGLPMENPRIKTLFDE